MRIRLGEPAYFELTDRPHSVDNTQEIVKGALLADVDGSEVVGVELLDMYTVLEAILWLQDEVSALERIENMATSVVSGVGTLEQLKEVLREVHREREAGTQEGDAEGQEAGQDSLGTQLRVLPEEDYPEGGHSRSYDP